MRTYYLPNYVVGLGCKNLGQVKFRGVTLRMTVLIDLCSSIMISGTLDINKYILKCKAFKMLSDRLLFLLFLLCFYHT